MMDLSNQSNSTSKTKPHSDSFVNPDLVARVKSASVFWDVEHSCRALPPIEEWVAAHQLKGGYGIDA